ncbi:MAG: hypothetical protein ACI96W_002967 [Paraglaciecola sp.]|jgi:hypothetical protein
MRFLVHFPLIKQKSAVLLNRTKVVCNYIGYFTDLSLYFESYFVLKRNNIQFLAKHYRFSP